MMEDKEDYCAICGDESCFDNACCKPQIKEAVKLCLVDDCYRPSRAGKMCNMHYRRWLIHGDANHLAIKSTRAMTLHERFIHNTTENTNECWLWSGTINPYGYGKLVGGNRSYMAHRYSYEHYIGEIPDGLLICHSCDVRNCVNPDHLFIGTPEDNSADMASKNRSCHGEKHYSSKLTSDNVIKIVEMLDTGTSAMEVSRIFGVAGSTIDCIKHGRSWCRVTGFENTRKSLCKHEQENENAEEQ